jgi:hypothetical protein
MDCQKLEFLKAKCDKDFQIQGFRRSGDGWDLAASHLRINSQHVHPNTKKNIKKHT